MASNDYLQLWLGLLHYAVETHWPFQTDTEKMGIYLSLLSCDSFLFWMKSSLCAGQAAVRAHAPPRHVESALNIPDARPAFFLFFFLFFLEITHAQKKEKQEIDLCQVALLVYPFCLLWVINRSRRRLQGNWDSNTSWHTHRQKHLCGICCPIWYGTNNANQTHHSHTNTAK